MTQRHAIDPALVRLRVPVETLETHPSNYRRGSTEGIRDSLIRFGQVRPIVVQASTNRIVAGNHTFMAARDLGWSHIAAARIDISDDEALAYLVADNRLTDIAENDDQALGVLLEQLALDGKLEGTGWVPDDVDDLLATLRAVEDKTPPAPDDTPPGPDRSAGAGPMPHREVVLMMTVEQRDAFTKHISRLQKVFETEGTAQTVLAVVADAARRADAPVS